MNENPSQPAEAAVNQVDENLPMLFYGSLRPKHYNFARFFTADNHQILKDNIVVPGFKMYNLGSYPCILKGESTDKIVCTAVKILDKYTQRHIHMMEITANYNCKTVEIPELGLCNIYVYADKNIPERYLVKSGNWDDNLKNNSFV
jgi:gamma-glutamylcyclotransferase (GGCT)/AIG2-like uncharacterized protein YtfP